MDGNTNVDEDVFAEMDTEPEAAGGDAPPEDDEPLCEPCTEHRVPKTLYDPLLPSAKELSLIHI